MKHKTTIALERETVTRLKGLCKVGETYDWWINKLIDEHKIKVE